jgi:hypothetical protein
MSLSLCQWIRVETRDPSFVVLAHPIKPYDCFSVTGSNRSLK